MQIKIPVSKKIKVGAVNYLNTKPLIYGFQHGLMQDDIELILDFPSKIATMLLNDEIDVGLIPVAVIPHLTEHYIISDFCIGSDGEVASVCLFSEVELNKIENVLLDYQSRTSAELLKILIRNFWKISPSIQETSSDYIDKIKFTTAGLIIGDRALKQRGKSAYHFDLGLEWKKYTGLPMVFAAWVSNKKLDDQFIREFNEANNIGLQQLDKVIQENPCSFFDLDQYYRRHIKYSLDERAAKGMELFLSKLPDFTLQYN